MKNKRYKEHFKEKILKEVNETGNISLVSRTNDVPRSTINNWISKAKDANDETEHKSNRQFLNKDKKQLEQKLIEIIKENEKIKEENEVLKKAMVIFTKK